MRWASLLLKRDFQSYNPEIPFLDTYSTEMQQCVHPQTLYRNHLRSIFRNFPKEKQLKHQQRINTVQQSHGVYDTAAHTNRPQLHTGTGQISQCGAEQGSQALNRALCVTYVINDIFI